MINSIPISIIIPTNNRIDSLLKILKAFSEQAFNPNDFEVIVVADDCNDNTVDVVCNTGGHYSFKIIVLDVQVRNAASARNAGAEKAKGKYLIFLDDDIIPFPDFISQHYHNSKSKQVIIGYSKPMFSNKPSIWQYRARRWWEDRFYEMSKPGHRFSFIDFFSGNFSISRDLFFSVGGFADTLHRHEDYEIGLKFIYAGIKFKFSYSIGGWHYETNDLKKWLERQKLYGYSNVRMIIMHPEVSGYFFKETFELYGLFSKVQLFVKRMAFKKDFLIKYPVKILFSSLYLFEKLRLYSVWEKIVGVLLIYKYWNGVSSELGSYENYLRWHNDTKRIRPEDKSFVTIDLKEMIASENLKVIENIEIKINYEGRHLFSYLPEEGTEPLNRNNIITEVESKLSGKINPYAFSTIS